MSKSENGPYEFLALFEVGLLKLRRLLVVAEPVVDVSELLAGLGVPLRLVCLGGDVEALFVVLKSLEEVLLGAGLLLLHRHVDVDLDEFLGDVHDVLDHVVILNLLKRLLKGLDRLLGALELVVALPHADGGEGGPVVVISLEGDFDAALVEVGGGLEVLVLGEEHLGEDVVALDGGLLLVVAVVGLGLDELVLELHQLRVVVPLVRHLDVVAVLVLQVLVVLAPGVDQDRAVVVDEVEEVDIRVNVPLGC